MILTSSWEEVGPYIALWEHCCQDDGCPAFMRGHKCSKRLTNLRFRRETAKEADYEMTWYQNNSWRVGNLSYHKPVSSEYRPGQPVGTGKRDGSADIKAHTEREKKGKRQRTGVRLGAWSRANRSMPAVPGRFRALKPPRGFGAQYTQKKHPYCVRERKTRMGVFPHVAPCKFYFCSQVQSHVLCPCSAFTEETCSVPQSE